MKEPMEALIRAFVKVEYPLKQGLKHNFKFVMNR